MTEKTLTVGSYKVENEPSIRRAGPISIGEGVLPSRYVMRSTPENPLHPWVTHLEVLMLDVIEQEGGKVVGVLKHRGFSQGHYCGTEEQAKEDFEARVSR